MNLLLRLFTWLSLFVRGLSGFEETFVRPSLSAVKELRDALEGSFVPKSVKKSKTKVDDKIYSAALLALTKAIQLLQGMTEASDKRTDEEVLHDFANYLQGLPRAVQDAILVKLASTNVLINANEAGHDISQHFADTVTQLTYTHDKHKASIA